MGQCGVVCLDLYYYYQKWKASSCKDDDKSTANTNKLNKLSSSFRQASTSLVANNDKAVDPVNLNLSKNEATLTSISEAQATAGGDDRRDLTPDEYLKLSKIMHNYTKDNKRQILEQQHLNDRTNKLDDRLQSVRTENDIDGEEEDEESNVPVRLQKQNIWLTSLQRRLNRLEALNRQVNRKKSIDND